MKILCVSDTVAPQLITPHAKDRFNGIDLILSCGDLTPEYLSSLEKEFSVPLFYIRGNHDIRYHNNLLAKCTNIHAQLIRYNGIRFLGLEGSHWYNGGPVQYREHEMHSLLMKLAPRLWFSGGIDIVISHAPIRFVNDENDLCHRGFECFYKIINRYEPQFFIHGHIHRNFKALSDRITTVKRTQVVNTYGYTIIEINSK